MASIPHFSSSWQSQLCTGPSDWSRDISVAGREPRRGQGQERFSGGAGPSESVLTGRMGPQVVAILRWSSIVMGSYCWVVFGEGRNEDRALKGDGSHSSRVQ